MKLDEFAFFNQQLAAMLRDGIPLESALGQLCASMRRGDLRDELEKLRKEEAETGKRLKQVKKDLRQEVVSLQTRLKWINILAVPLAVTATGIVIAVVKRRKTSAK